MTTELLTPVGRIVWGNPLRAVKKTDIRTKQPKLRADGTQAEQWVFGVAIPKAEFDQQVRPVLEQEAAQNFPQGVPSNFAWKFKDGDSIDQNGQPFSLREGWAGHYVLTVSTEAFAPPVYKNEAGQYRQLKEGEIKTGDYVVVKINTKFNGAVPPNTPGLYINPVGIELVGYGAEIVSSSADPNEMFGGNQYALPPGASTTPIAPNTGVAAPYDTNAVPAQPAPVAAPVTPQPVAALAQPAPLPPPATGFVESAATPVTPQPVAAPAQPLPVGVAQQGR